MGDSELGLESRLVELGQLAAVLKGHAGSGELDIGVGVGHGGIEVGDSAQHEALDLGIGDIKGLAVETVQLVEELGLFHPALQSAEADIGAVGGIGVGGEADHCEHGGALTRGKAGGRVFRRILGR